MHLLRSLSERLFGVPRRQAGEGDLALLGDPASEAEAELWRNILEQWGVRCLIKNTSATAYLRLGDAYQVWVLHEDLEEASSLIFGGRAPSVPPTNNGHDE